MKDGTTQLARRQTTRNYIKMTPYLFLFPTIVVFLVFMVYPVIDSLILSFHTFEKGTYEFVGFGNYLTLFKDPIFYKSLGNTFFYLIIQVPVMIGLALLLAVLIEQKFIRGRSIFRMSIFLPTITALVAYALVFKVLFNTDYGLINYIIESLGGTPVAWIYDGWAAKFSIILSITWRWTGYNMIILIAGLQNIDGSLYESADIDGANFWQKLTRITIPMLKPIILFTSITSTIGTLQLFDESYVLTNGGPDYATITTGHYLYDNGFRYLKYGYAAAISYVLVLIIGALSLIQFRVSKEDS